MSKISGEKARAHLEKRGRTARRERDRELRKKHLESIGWEGKKEEADEAAPGVKKAAEAREAKPKKVQGDPLAEAAETKKPKAKKAEAEASAEAPGVAAEPKKAKPKKAEADPIAQLDEIAKPKRKKKATPAEE
jgi:hypothetical protein